MMGAEALSSSQFRKVSPEWSHADMDCYLDRCQVDTPHALVARLWKEIHLRREQVGTVLDFGAGDGRFALYGRYQNYFGYEIDGSRTQATSLPSNAEIVHGCAFTASVAEADLAIGNPPFVRNQDLPDGWRERVSDKLFEKTGLKISGLANAWQYFFLQALISTKPDGLCALVIPFEWVSRPSVAMVREFIRANGWDVDVVRLCDSTFGGVLTTASITLIDKRSSTGRWRYFEDIAGSAVAMPSPSRGDQGHLDYAKSAKIGPRAARGLSPGSQKVFTFTEAERARLGLKIDRDVVRCVTSLRPLAKDRRLLDRELFDEVYRVGGQRCWLLAASRSPSATVMHYLESIPPEARSTKTCLARPVWWRYEMPNVPQLLVATCFKGERPKHVRNEVGAIAVGGVAGVFGDEAETALAMDNLAKAELSDRIVAHSNGLYKIEIAQLNTLIRGRK